MNEDAPRTVDPDRLRETSQQVFGALSGAMTAAMIYLGDRLGLYRALAGRPPFEGTSFLHQLHLIMKKDPPPPSAVRPGVHPDLDTISLRCLEKHPGRRYPSAAALARDLERFMNGEVIEGIAPIGETPLQAVNVTNRGLGGRNTLQTRPKHQPRPFMPNFAIAGLTHHHPLQQLINAT